MNPQPMGAGVGNSLYKNIKQSSTHPKFLHSNSTSHVWAFSAIAELIDNASDPDVQATELHIDAELDGVPRLTFTDNGFGMPPHKLHKMLSFGYCEKVEINGHKPIGHYGNGFKSGSMRLGRDALVFTKYTDSMSCGFLSQTFLEATQSDCVLVPMVTWNLQKKLLLPEAEANENLAPMFTYSPFKNIESLLQQFDHIKKTGTKIVIFNLRKEGNMLEFNFDEDKRDLRIRGDNQVTGTVGAAGRKFQRQRVNQDPTTDIPLDYSLRAYCEVLYLRPRMLIYIRSFKVRTKMIAHSLTKTRVDTYRPFGLNTTIKITYGLNGENLNVYGMMLYHRNRLIKPYVRVGIQLQNNKEGVGVIGVIEADFLQPTHNKQDFDYTPAYRRCIVKLADLLELYWYDIKKSPSATQPKKVQPATNGTHAANNSAVVPIAKPPQSQIILLPYTDAPIPADPNAKPDVIPYTYADSAELVDSETTPDEIWVQCDNCLKWRKLPASTRAEALPDKWYCYMNTHDPARSDCAVAQQADDEPDELVSLKTARKKQKEMEKLAQANKRAEEAKRAAALQQDELAKKQAEEKRLREMEAETNRLKAEQEKQRKIIEDQRQRELQYQEQVRAMMEKEQLLKQKEAMMKAEEDKKRKEIETWLQAEESNLKKRKTSDDELPAKSIHVEPKIESHPPSTVHATAPSLSSSSSIPTTPTSATPVHIPSYLSTPISTSTPPLPPSSSSFSSSSSSSSSPTASSIPPKPLSTAIKRLSQPTTNNSPPTHISAPPPTHIPSTPSPFISSTPPTYIPTTAPSHIPSTPPSYVSAPPPHISSPPPPPSTSVPPSINLELHNKAFMNMALLVNSLNIQGVYATPDAQSLASLDVNHLIELAHAQYSAKPRAELTSLRQWVKKLLTLLARTKDINVEDAELDSYFVEWVKRQEAKRKTEASA